MTINLPWPPSMNHYWRHVGAKVLISSEGRRFRKEVADAVFLQRRDKNDSQAFTKGSRLSVTIYAFQPDRRRRDLDNLLKPVLDALEHTGVYADDSQIDVLEVRRCGHVEGGCLTVTLWEV